MAITTVPANRNNSGDRASATTPETRDNTGDTGDRDTEITAAVTEAGPDTAKATAANEHNNSHCNICNKASHGKTVLCDMCNHYIHYTCENLTDSEIKKIEESNHAFTCSSCSVLIEDQPDHPINENTTHGIDLLNTRLVVNIPPLGNVTPTTSQSPCTPATSAPPNMPTATTQITSGSDKTSKSQPTEDNAEGNATAMLQPKGGSAGGQAGTGHAKETTQGTLANTSPKVPPRRKQNKKANMQSDIETEQAEQLVLLKNLNRKYETRINALKEENRLLKLQLELREGDTQPVTNAAAQKNPQPPAAPYYENKTVEILQSSMAMLAMANSTMANAATQSFNQKRHAPKWRRPYRHDWRAHQPRYREPSWGNEPIIGPNWNPRYRNDYNWRGYKPYAHDESIVTDYKHGQSTPQPIDEPLIDLHEYDQHNAVPLVDLDLGDQPTDAPLIDLHNDDQLIDVSTTDPQEVDHNQATPCILDNPVPGVGTALLQPMQSPSQADADSSQRPRQSQADDNTTPQTTTIQVDVNITQRERPVPAPRTTRRTTNKQDESKKPTKNAANHFLELGPIHPLPPDQTTLSSHSTLRD